MQVLEWPNLTMNTMKDICLRLDAQGVIIILWNVLNNIESPPGGR